MIFLRILLFLIGVAVVLRMLQSAITTFVLPRGVPDKVTRAVFRTSRRIFDLILSRQRSYEERDRIMAVYGPVSLLLLPVFWLAWILLAYAAMFFATGTDNAAQAITMSGSSLLTLGFSEPTQLPRIIIAFSEATIGLGLLALLIAYLPAMYNAWSRRELAVAMLQVRAGSPPSALVMIRRYNTIQGLNRLNEIWPQWETWFVDIEETHTSLAAITFFRSPQPQRSWVTAAGAVLDAGSFMASSVDLPRNPDVELTIRAGYLALRSIATFFRLPYNPDPHFPADPISIKREEYDQMYEELAAEGVPLKPDRNQAWLAFAGWRVNYDTVLRQLAHLTMAPYAPWSSDGT